MMTNFNLNSVPIVYESVRLVKGAINYLVIDLQRQTYFKIDKFTYDFLSDIYQRKSIANIFNNRPQSDHDVIIENLNLLIQHELIFLTENPEWFPCISENWDSPQLITNAIFDISLSNFNYFERFLNQITELGCQHLQVRDWDYICLNKITQIIQQCMDKDILGVELIASYSKISGTDAEKIMIAYPKINQIILFDAPNDQFIRIENSTQIICYSTAQNLSEKNCGCINSNYFTISTEFFFESKIYNSCLNRKLTVDRNGFIKNCPSMQNHFGHISTSCLSDIVLTQNFQRTWKINKDSIEKCKDCEFRYMCVDSCPLKYNTKSKLYERTIQCNYCPYKNIFYE